MVWVIGAVVAVGIFAAVVVILRRGLGKSAVGKAEVAIPKPLVSDDVEREASAASTPMMGEVAAAGQREPAPPEPGAPRKILAPESAEPSGAPDGAVEAANGAGEVRGDVETVGRAAEAELPEQARAELEEAARLLDELRDVVSGLEGTDSTVEGSVEIMGEGLQEVRTLTEKGQWSQARDKGAALKAQLSLLLQSARREPTA